MILFFGGKMKNISLDVQKEEKGNAGEKIVKEFIVDLLEKEGIFYQIEQNIILEYESLFGSEGKFGYSTTEIDIVVFTRFFIFLFEVKNVLYQETDYNESTWIVVNGETTSNPLMQNHNHKCILCSELKIPREKVITIEVLLENGKIENTISPYKNDYVFNKEDLYNKLKWLLISCDNKEMPMQDWYNLLLSKKAKIQKEEHIRNIDTVEAIEKRIWNATKKRFHRTDIIYCPRCENGKLSFMHKLWHSEGHHKRKSEHYFMGCSNYRSEIPCKGLIYVEKGDDNREFLNLQAVTIEQRNNWGEERMIKTCLEEYEHIMTKLKNAEDRVALCEKDIEELTFQNEYLQDKIISYQNKLEETKQEFRQEITKFKKIFGLFYIKK